MTGRNGTAVAVALLFLVLPIGGAIGPATAGVQGVQKKWTYNYFDYFYDVASSGGQDYWIVGKNGRILRSSDNGKSWDFQNSGVKVDLFSVSFIDPKRGWCSGGNGTILHTEDGGETWVAQKSGTGHPIFRIRFVSGTVGYACGYFGLILRTADGGKSWENRSLKDDVALRGMAFHNEKSGFIVGEFGTILKTSDGGNTFTRTVSPVPLTLFTVHFQDESTGYAGGIDGTIIATTNGGKTWRKEDSGTADHLMGMHSRGGLAVGVGLRGTVVSKAKGGRWSAVDSRTLSWLSGISMDDSGKGYAVGAHGTILRLEDILAKGGGK